MSPSSRAGKRRLPSAGPVLPVAAGVDKRTKNWELLARVRIFLLTLVVSLLSSDVC